MNKKDLTHYFDNQLYSRKDAMESLENLENNLFSEKELNIIEAAQVRFEIEIELIEKIILDIESI